MPREKGDTPDSTELAAQSAIRELLANHSRGLDRMDSACLQACYWPEAEVDYGNYKGSAHQFAELVVPALSGTYQLTRHSLDNMLIDIDHDQAKVESYVTAWHLLLDGKEEMVFSGRYLDRLERRHNHWKLIHRQVVMDWSRRLPVVDERHGDAFAALAKGTTGTDDPLYNFLKSPD